MVLDFILSRFGISRRIRTKEEIVRISYVANKIFPLNNAKLALRRAKNILLSFVAWRYGIIINNIKPSILQIETVSGCNFNCLMCRAGENKKEFMSFEDFSKIFEKIPEAFVAIMNLSGEPFLSKDTIKMIKYASSERNILVNIFSNFSVLPDPYQVIQSGLYEIHASVDSFDEKKFSKIREGGDLKKVLHNLQKLVEAKRKTGKYLPIISINAVLSEENTEDAEEIIKNGIKIGVDRIKFQRLLFNVPELHVPSEKSRQKVQELKEKYKNKIEIVLNNFEDIGTRANGYCYLAYFMATIRVNGTLYPCCMPYPFFFPTESIMGNIFENEKTFYQNRAKFIRNFRSNPPQFCKQCPIYKR